MAIIISDANILIDLNAASLLRVMFRLNHTFAVPDVLYQEELATHHGDLPGLGLRIERVDGDVVAEAARLMALYDGLSHFDTMALALARQSRRLLLTGDAKLRSAAVAEHIRVKGTVWLMGELYEAGLIDIDRMVEAYDEMRAMRRRLPWDRVEQQIAGLKKGR